MVKFSPYLRSGLGRRDKNEMTTRTEYLKEYGIVERPHDDIRVVQEGTLRNVSINGKTMSPKKAAELALKLSKIDDTLSHKISHAAAHAQDTGGRS